MVEAGDKCGAGPPRCKWPFSQPRRQLLSATHSHLVPLLFSSTNHFILAGSLPSVQCWQAPLDSNVMQAEHFNPVPPSSSRNFVQTQMIDCFGSVWETGGGRLISVQHLWFQGDAGGRHLRQYQRVLLVRQKCLLHAGHTHLTNLSVRFFTKE